MEEHVDLNASSLLDLKAELHKKYESFRRAKVVQESEPEKRPTTFKRKGEEVSKVKKPKQKDEKTSVESTPEEEIDLKKSRLALEAKAKLYEKLSRSSELIDDEESERYLVDFNRKILYETPVTIQETSQVSDNHSSPYEDEPVYSSSELREIYQRKTEAPNSHDSKDPSEKVDEEPIHYQNVQFNEVRDHGTGYFAFSMDESKRREQMEELRNLRQQTEEQRLSSKNILKKKKESLQARLAKVCERRNIDKSVIEHYTASEEADETNIEEQNVDLSSIPLPQPAANTEKKPVKVRPWDVGKTEFPQFIPEKRKLKSQKDYVEERRSDRLAEFAPPTVYK